MRDRSTTSDGITRRRLVEALGATGAAAALAGCGGNSGGGGSGGDGENGGDATSTTEQQDVSLTLSGWASSNAEADLLTDLLGSYESGHEHVSVDYSAIQGKYKQKIKTQLGAGNAPDTFYVDSSYFTSFADAGVLLDLSSYIDDDDSFDMDAFYEPLAKAFEYDGSYYGVPKDFSTLGYFYNESIYQEAGLDDAPTTWSEWRSDLEAIKSKTDIDAPMMAFGTPRLFWPLLYQNGGRVLSDDSSECVVGSQEAVEALEFVVGLHEDGLAKTKSEIDAGWPGAGLGKKEIAVGVLGPWGFPYLSENAPDVDEHVKVADHIPTPEGGEKATMAYTVSYSASANTGDPDAVWDLISYLTGEEGMTEWAKAGIALTARKDLADLDYYEEHPRHKTLLEAAEHSHVWGFGPQSEAIVSAIKPQLQGAMVGSISAEEALAKAQQQVNEKVLN